MKEHWPISAQLFIYQTILNLIKVFINQNSVEPLK